MSKLHIFCKFLETYLLFLVSWLVHILIFLKLLFWILQLKKWIVSFQQQNFTFYCISMLAFNCKVPLQIKHYLHLDPVGAKFRHYHQLIKIHWEWWTHKQGKFPFNVIYALFHIYVVLVLEVSVVCFIYIIFLPCELQKCSALNLSFIYKHN